MRVLIQCDRSGAAGVVLSAPSPGDRLVVEVDGLNPTNEPTAADVDLDGALLVGDHGDRVWAAGVVLDAAPPGDRLVAEVDGPDMVEEPTAADMDLEGMAAFIQGDRVGASRVVLDALSPGDGLVVEVDNPDPGKEALLEILWRTGVRVCAPEDAVG